MLAAVHGADGRSPVPAVRAAKAGVCHSEAASGQAGLLRVQGVAAGGVWTGDAQLRALSPQLRERMGSGGMRMAMVAQGGQARMRGFVGVSSFGYRDTISHAVVHEHGCDACTSALKLVVIVTDALASRTSRL